MRFPFMGWVLRRKSNGYQLIWKERTGFARLDIEHGYDILPFASIGANESYDILLDADDVQRTSLWNWLGQRAPLAAISRDGEIIPPLAKGLGFAPVPRPQRIYFKVGWGIEDGCIPIWVSVRAVALGSS